MPYQNEQDTGLSINPYMCTSKHSSQGVHQHSGGSLPVLLVVCFAFHPPCPSWFGSSNPSPWSLYHKYGARGLSQTPVTCHQVVGQQACIIQCILMYDVLHSSHTASSHTK